MAQEPVAVVTANDDPQPKDASLCIAIKPADAVVTAQSQPRSRVQRLLKKGGKFFPRMSPMQVCQTLRFLHSQDLIQQERQAVDDAFAAAVAAPTTELRVQPVSLDSDGDESERVMRRPSPSPFDNGTRPFWHEQELPTDGCGRGMERGRAYKARPFWQKQTSPPLEWTDVHNEASCSKLAAGLQRSNYIDFSAHYAMSPYLPVFNNLVISNLTLGADCKIGDLVEWCKVHCTEHVVVVSVLTGAASFLRDFARKATLKSVQDSLQHQDVVAPFEICQDAEDIFQDKELNESINVAVAAVTESKFIFAIWDDAFVIVNRFTIDSVQWTEWEAGSCASRFGTLDFKLNPGRVQQPDCRIGIVKIPDGTSDLYPEDGVWDKLTRWITAEAPMLVTGHFGKDNDTGIAHTAVAVGASVNHRMRVKIQSEEDHLNNKDVFGFGPGGFLVCYACKRPIEAVSPVPSGLGQLMGTDIIDCVEVDNIEWLIEEHADNDRHKQMKLTNYRRGYLQVDFIGTVKMKTVDWTKSFPGMLNCRLYLGDPLPGKVKRKQAQDSYAVKANAASVKRRRELGRLANVKLRRREASQGTLPVAAPFSLWETSVDHPSQEDSSVLHHHHRKHAPDVSGQATFHHFPTFVDHRSHAPDGRGHGKGNGNGKGNGKGKGKGRRTWSGQSNRQTVAPPDCRGYGTGKGKGKGKGTEQKSAHTTWCSAQPPRNLARFLAHQAAVRRGDTDCPW